MTTSSGIRIGVLGAGHLGKIHIRLILQLPEFNLIGFYDPDAAARERVAAEFNIKAYDNEDELIKDVDALDIVTPTLHHFACAAKAIKLFKHVFIEKPVTATLEE